MRFNRYWNSQLWECVVRDLLSWHSNFQSDWLEVSSLNARLLHSRYTDGVSALIFRVGMLIKQVILCRALQMKLKIFGKKKIFAGHHFNKCTFYAFLILHNFYLTANTKHNTGNFVILQTAASLTWVIYAMIYSDATHGQRTSWKKQCKWTKGKGEGGVFGFGVFFLDRMPRLQRAVVRFASA